MKNPEEILSRPDVKEFMETHQGAAARVKKAVTLLVNKNEVKDEIESIKKLFTALTNNSVSVFFSYKKKDESAAKEIVTVLRKFAGERLKITYAAEFKGDIVGKHWRSKIREEIHHANWFILLFPDPSDDWDWCLYETGLFESQFTSADSLICLHHPDTKIPNPIEGYQAVSATIPDVEAFLDTVYRKDNPVFGLDAINPHVDDKDIEACAKRIVDAIRPPKSCIVQNIYEPWVLLKFENLLNLHGKKDLDKALLLNANKEALDLFDFDQKPKTWGDLTSSLPKANGNFVDDRWQEELFHVIKKISEGRKFTPIQAVFKTMGDKLIRPVIYAVDRMKCLNGNIVSFQITFSEDVGVVDNSSIPENVSVLASYLRFAFRFRWEILEKYTVGNLSEEDVERLYNSMERIRTDAKSRGIAGIDAVLPVFDSDQMKKIQDMYQDWYQASNPQRIGELDLAIANKETGKITEILKRFVAPSQEFLEIAANRFSELVSKSPYSGYVN